MTRNRFARGLALVNGLLAVAACTGTVTQGARGDGGLTQDDPAGGPDATAMTPTPSEPDPPERREEPPRAEAGPVEPVRDATSPPNPGPPDAGVPDVGVPDTGPEAGPTGADCPTIVGLRAYYGFDGNALDGTVNGHNAVATNVVAVTGKLGFAYRFNGVSSLVKIGGPTFKLTGERSLCAWVRPNVASGLALPIFVGGSAGAADIHAIATSGAAGSCASAAGALLVDHTGSSCYTVSTVKVLPTNWNFVCFAATGVGQTAIFANDKTAASSVASFAFDITSMTLGSSVVGGGTTRAALDGDLDEVSIWSRVLTTPEMVSLYANGNGCRIRPAR